METYQSSAEATEQLKETFQFLKHDREDVRKMAVHGIAEHSKDNRDLWAFMSDKKEGGKAIDALLLYLHAGSANILGDILTILINVSAEGSCAELLVEHKVVRKAMRLLDGMEKSALPDEFVRSVEELTFMLLSNLTASHVSAVDDLLQKDDEDMRGFYLGKLQKYYAFLTPRAAVGAPDGAGAKPRDQASEAKKLTPAEEEREEQAGRDLRKWILQVLLNITRTCDGQELLLEDDDWRVTLNECLQSNNAMHRLLAAQCFRNCACSQKPRYELLLKSDALITAVQRLGTREERNPQVQLCLAEFIASMLESEEGMSRLEGINARRLLLDSVNESRTMLDREREEQAEKDAQNRVEVLDDDEPAAPAPAAGSSGAGVDEVDGDVVLPAAVAAPPLAPDACETLEKHVLPYLDDIVDAYLAPGSDEID